MSDTSNKSFQILSIIGFSVLSALCGIGVAWILVCIAKRLFEQDANPIVNDCMPVLMAGGVVGLVAGLVVAVRVARLDPQNKQSVVRKYVGRRGRIRIYGGAPLFVVFACSPVVNLLSRHFGDRVAIWCYFGFFLAVVGVSLFLYDRIPARFIIPIGITGRLLIVLLAVVFFIYTMR